MDSNGVQASGETNRPLAVTVKKSLITLMREIETSGPVRGNWPNYGLVRKAWYHCHLKNGRPTYVAIGEVVNKDIKVVEVIYAGTHERAPY